MKHLASSAADTRRVGEEAPGEHLERQVPSGRREVDPFQERFRVHMVESPIDVGHGHRSQRGGRAGVQAGQITQPKCGAAQRECEGVPRRRARQTAEAVAPTVPVDQRVVVDGTQPIQFGSPRRSNARRL